MTEVMLEFDIAAEKDTTVWAIRERGKSKAQQITYHDIIVLWDIMMYFLDATGFSYIGMRQMYGNEKTKGKRRDLDQVKHWIKAY